MPRKKPSQSRALVPVAKPTTYPIANTRIEVLQLHRVRERHTQGHGPWAGEHEKIAWIDPATRLHCTILRQRDGSLSGWVGVFADHPLFGFEHDAIPADLNLSVHGGLQEAQICDEDGPENVSVCHAGVGDDPLWWFGFTCDHSYDFVPGKYPASLAAENGQTYRTEGYVFEQCSSLARQLDQIGKATTPDAGRRDPELLDEQGRAWTSVREALWVSRLGMADWARSEPMHQELEFLLAVLVAIDRRIIGTEEQVLDYFGNWDKARFYAAWLHGQKLVEPDPDLRLSGSLTPEGRAILVMLASTRRLDERPVPLGLPTLRPSHGLNIGIGEETRETIIRAQEAAAQRLRYRFICEELHNRPGIVLLGDGLGLNVPLRRKLWSISYPDVYARDRMYLWLHDRIDRWNHYGELAFRNGARALSEHLLQMRFADEAIEVE